MIFIVFRVASLRRNTFNGFNSLSFSWISSCIFENFDANTVGKNTEPIEDNVKTKKDSDAGDLLKQSFHSNKAEENVDYLVNHHNQETELLNYQDFAEKVEDTKASVWVVFVNPPTAVKSVEDVSRHSDFQKLWYQTSLNLTENGIRTGSYECIRDIRLCLIHKITTPSVLLTMPKGSQPKGKVITHLFKPKLQQDPLSLFEWVQRKLHPKVKTVHSLSELTEPPAKRGKKEPYQDSPSMYFVYKAKDNAKPPLSISALSVKFTGRIKFYMLRGDYKEGNNDGFLAMNKFSKYSYGEHKGESFTYSCMELFLKTLHPEVNDVFIASVILLNMACWFEVSLQKGGPLRRLLFYIWGFATSNILLVTIWLPLLKLIYLPQLQPFVEMCLESLQKFMFTNTAATLREDFIELNKHFHIVLFGCVCYGIFLGYLHFKFRNESNNLSFSGLLQNDINSIRDSFNTLIENITPNFRIYQFEARIERILSTLSRSELWLPTDSSSDYIKDLPTWRYCGYFENVEELVENIEASSLPSESEDDSLQNQKMSSIKTDCPRHCSIDCLSIPEYIFKVNECVICLEKFTCGAVLMGLSCGHSFHKNCASNWLFLESAQNKCPVCRWPCNVKKGTKLEIIDAT